MSMLETIKGFWSKNFVEIIRPLGASPAFMGEDEDEHESDLARGFNWSAAPVIGRELIPIEAEPPIEPTIQMAVLETTAEPSMIPDIEIGKFAPAEAGFVPPVLPVALPTGGEAPAVAPSLVASINEHPTSSAPGRDFSLAVSFNGVVSSKGTVDFDGLFKAAALPDAPITAEQGAWILNMLPMDLPLRVRRISARSSLEAISKFDTAAASASVTHIVSDAALKMLYVSKLAKELASHGAIQRSRAETEIAALEEEIQARRSAMVEIDHNYALAQDSCRTRMAKLNDVIQFFDHADFAQDGEASAMVELENSNSSMDTPLRMVGGSIK